MSGMSCNADCPLYHEASQQCKIVMAINRYLGPVDGPTKTPPPTPKIQSPLVADAMKQTPDFSQIEWMVKGNQPASSTAPFAYAFAFEYQTQDLRPEAEDLYQYLLDNKELTLDGFTYTISGKDKNLFARNKAKA